MRFNLIHTGFVRGKARSLRNYGELPVYLETSVEVPEYSRNDFQKACTLVPASSSDGPGFDFLWKEETFYKPYKPYKPYRPYSDIFARWIRDPSVEVAIPLDAFDSVSDTKSYYERCEYTSFQSRLASQRCRDPRVLDSWKASDIDDTDVHLFRSAAEDFMRSFAVVDGVWHVKCFEPSYKVRAEFCEISPNRVTLMASRANDLELFCDAVALDDDGLCRFRISSDVDRFYRNFSLLEYDRIDEYVSYISRREHLCYSLRSEVTYAGGFVDINQELFSDSFDRKEFFKSGLLLASLSGFLERHSHQHSRVGFARYLDQDEIDDIASQLRSSLLRYQDGIGSQADALDRMSDMRDYLINSLINYRSSTSVDMLTKVPPPYFGDPDDHEISLEVGRRSLLGS